MPTRRAGKPARSNKGPKDPRSVNRQIGDQSYSCGYTIITKRLQAVFLDDVQEAADYKVSHDKRHHKADGDVDVLAVAERASFVVQLLDGRGHHCGHRQIEG